MGIPRRSGNCKDRRKCAFRNSGRLLSDWTKTAISSDAGLRFQAKQPPIRVIVPARSFVWLYNKGAAPETFTERRGFTAIPHILLMTRSSLFTAALISLLPAQETPGPPPPEPEHRESPPMGSPLQRGWQKEGMRLFMEKYDKDRDGRLNEAERREAEADAAILLRAKKEAILDRYDANGNGRLEPEELAAMRSGWEQQNPGIGRRVRHKMRNSRRDERLDLLRRFDKDGDGQLNEEEKAALHQWLQEYHQERHYGVPRPSFPDLPPRREAPQKSAEPHPAPCGEGGRLPRAGNTLPYPVEGILIEALILERYDTDRDGRISEEEAQAIPSQDRP